MRNNRQPLLYRTVIVIYSANSKFFRHVPVIVDTGATVSLIPPQRLLDLGYDLTNAERKISETVNGEVSILFVPVTRMIALGKSVENIIVSCLDPNKDILESSKRRGLLGMNFLQQFDNLNFSFSGQCITLI